MKPLTILKYMGIAALTVYLSVVVYFYVRQDHLTFYAQPEPEVPFEGLTETRVSTQDGETLIAWTRQAQAGCPTVLLFHGQWTKLSRHKAHYDEITNRGLGLFALTWRGFNGSTGKPSEVGLHLDAAAGYQALLQAGLTPDEIIIQGISLGTGPATRLASEQDAAALILEAPYMSTVSVAQERYPYLPIGLLAKHTFKSKDWIGNVFEPLLIAHGSADDVIPIAQGRGLFELANAPKRFEEFSGVDHVSLAQNGLFEDAIWPFLTPLFPDCLSEATPAGDAK